MIETLIRIITVHGTGVVTRIVTLTVRISLIQALQFQCPFQISNQIQSKFKSHFISPLTYAKIFLSNEKKCEPYDRKPHTIPPESYGENFLFEKLTVVMKFAGNRLLFEFE